MSQQETYIKQLVDLALQYHQANQLTQASHLYQQVLQIQPDHAESLHWLGMIAFQTGQHKTGIELLHRAIKYNPHDAIYYTHLAKILAAENRLSEAIGYHQKALQIKPQDAGILNDLGICFHELEQWEMAVQCFQQSVDIETNNAKVHNNLANTLVKLDKIDEAIIHYQTAITLMPSLAGAYAGLGDALYHLGQIDKSIESCQQAIQLEPSLPNGYQNLGIALARKGQLKEALNVYEQALTLNFNAAMTHFNKAVAFLSLGQFKQAWQEHIWRHSIPKRDIPTELHYFKTIMQQKTLHRKRILLMKEQGLGDELFFLRFAPFLHTKGAQLIYECGSKLQTLLNRHKIFKQVILSQQEIKQHIDYKLYIGDLPLISSAFSSIPTPPPLFLSVLPERLAAMRIQLAQLGPPPYLGFTWRAGTQQKQWSMKRSLYKEVDLSQLASILISIPATFLILQRHPQLDEINQLKGLCQQPIHDLSHINENLEDMLALLSLLDSYVGVSNTNMHLLAGLGKTAHVLIPFPADWRWLHESSESPWFPGFSLYRQTNNLDWSSALDQLAKNLQMANKVIN